MFLMLALFGIMAVLFLLFIYFIPTFVAVNRGHHNRAAIFILNLFLGWSFVGWVIALTWSMTKVENEYISLGPVTTR